MLGFIQPVVNEAFVWLEKERRDSAVDILKWGDCGRIVFLFPKKDQRNDTALFSIKQTNEQLTVKINKEILRNYWENIVGISEKEPIYNVKKM